MAAAKKRDSSRAVAGEERNPRRRRGVSYDESPAVAVASPGTRPSQDAVDPHWRKRQEVMKLSDDGFVTWRKRLDSGQAARHRDRDSACVYAPKILGAFSVHCRTCRAFDFPHLDEGTDMYNHLASERHEASIAAAEREAGKVGSYRPLCGRDGFRPWHASVSVPARAAVSGESSASHEKCFIENVLQEMKRSDAARGWALRSLNAEDVVDACDREAVARELAFEMARRWEWREPDDALKSTPPASGLSFRAEKLVGLDFSELHGLRELHPARP